MLCQFSSDLALGVCREDHTTQLQLTRRNAIYLQRINLCRSPSNRWLRDSAVYHGAREVAGRISEITSCVWSGNHLVCAQRGCGCEDGVCLMCNSWDFSLYDFVSSY